MINGNTQRHYDVITKEMDKCLLFKRIDRSRIESMIYLRKKYRRGDLSWHPLFTAMRDLWVSAYNGELKA